MHVVNNQDRTWASPAAAGPVSARVRLPASKSVTNRALVLAALSDGPAAAGEAQVRSWLLTGCMPLSLLCQPAGTVPMGLARPDCGYELPIQA